MTVLVFEDNLMWSKRLQMTLADLSHDPIVFATVPDQLPRAEAAIINLGSSAFELEVLLSILRAAGVYVIGHAGHKEHALLEKGRAAGCDVVASNSQLTFKLKELLVPVKMRDMR